MAKVRVKRFNVTLERGQWKWLQDEARKLKMSASALLRRILDHVREA